MSLSVWQEPEIISWSEILTESYKRLLNKDLVAPQTTKKKLAKILFFAPFVIVSHGIQADPILNYGNQIALKLWETNWEQFTQTPSRLTAEPINRQTRAEMLEKAARLGYIDDYQGVRISSQGRKFLIQNAIIWNLTDKQGNYCGQAATFFDWKMI